MRSQGLNFKSPVEFFKKKKVQGITFTRASVAYDGNFNQVPANTPRFNQGSLGSGLLIEEATTNLFPSAQSQSFTNAWTSGTLNGTYTVSINAGGSLVLSGGATGTCESGGTLTFTVSNATVTFTPTGTPTHSQLELKAFSTSWTLGGTTRASEGYNIPVSRINLTHGTIEINFNVDLKVHNVTNHWAGLFLFASSDSKEWIGVANKNDGWYLDIGHLGVQTLSSRTNISTGIHNFKMAYDSSSVILYVDNVEKVRIDSPTLPVSISRAWIGCSSYTDTPLTSLNSIIKTVMISNIKRQIEPVNVVDKNVTLAMPNLNDLRAYYETGVV